LQSLQSNTVKKLVLKIFLIGHLDSIEKLK
jgi:hypothetical protein